MSSNSTLIYRTVPVGPLQCNCRILACPRTGDTLLVDPGDEPSRLISEIERLKTASGAPLRVKHLFHTHAHFDHFGGTRGVAEHFRAKPDADAAEILLHRDDSELYRQLRAQGQRFGLPMEDPLPVDRFVADEEELRVGDLKFSVIHTPGHSPGGVCLRLHEDSAIGARERVFSGDTLFSSSIGRTDLWGGDLDTLLSSIRQRLFTLDDDTEVCPGHGPDSRMGIEKRENPFLT